jgi:hypothetical protein
MKLILGKYIENECMYTLIFLWCYLEVLIHPPLITLYINSNK